MSPELASRAGAALRTEGYQVFDSAIIGLPAVVGQRRLFRWSWLATQLKVTVVVAAAETLSAGDWQAALVSGFELAKKAPGWPNGLQSGSALVCVLAVDRPDPGAVALAEAPPPLEWFKGVTCNALVDTTTGTAHTCDDKRFVGRVYTRFLHSQRDLVLDALRGSS